MKKIFSIFLALLFLLSNLQLLIGTHYCGGRPVDTAILFGEITLGCGMEEDVEEICELKVSKSEPGIWQKDCCRDDIASLQIDESFNKRIQHELIPDVLKTLIELPVIFISSIEIVDEKINIPDRSPPRVERDILTLFQVFLI